MAKRPKVDPTGPVATFLQRLGPKARQSGDGWIAPCPAHKDRKPSLSIGLGDDGRVLLHCFLGCTIEAIVAALGLQLSDLFPSNGRRDDKRATSPRVDDPGLTLATYAEAKGLPLDFLRSQGISDTKYRTRPAIRIPYFDIFGLEIGVRFRLSLHGTPRFVWRRHDRVTLYGLWRLAEARKTGFLVICEGESDCHTLWLHGIPAVGLPGANNWREEWAQYFAGTPVIFVLVEPDEGGDAVLKWLARSCIRDRVHLVRLETAKDPSALHLQDRSEFVSAWDRATGLARRWDDVSREHDHRAAANDYETARELLNDPQLLDHIGHVMQSRGLAGDVGPGLLAYVAVTSRLLDRPLNLAFVGPSAAGKNRALDAALELMPPEAIYTERAGSARALVYVDEAFEHRTIVIMEADSIPEDGPAASAVRSLATDNVLAYDVVEKNPRTGRHGTRRIEKPGPTGLITTSTKSLPTQMGTRVLEVPIPDDPQQTRAVMEAHARAASSTQKIAPIPDAIVSLQRWLALVGERRVVIPFANVLAERVPSTAVRMRRDFRQLLTSIQAVAFLYQSQRSKTADGAVVATLEDYVIARQLLASIFDSISAEGLTRAVRATVEAVQDGEEVSQVELGKRLKLARSSVSYRVNRALAGGWLVNSETRVNAPARLVRGAPLPDAACALPLPETVRTAFECSNQFSDPHHTPSADCVGKDDGYEEGTL